MENQPINCSLLKCKTSETEDQPPETLLDFKLAQLIVIAFKQYQQLTNSYRAK